MMARPCAKAIAVIPGRPTPLPTTAAAPAPMNTKAKVPTNSARSFGAIRLDIVFSIGEIDRAARSGARRGSLRWFWGMPTARERAVGRRRRAGVLRGDHLRFEIDAQRLGDAGAIFGIGLVAVDDLPLDDLGRHAFHRSLVVMEQLLLLIGAHQPEQLSGLTIVVVAIAMIVAGRITHDLERRLAVAVVLERAVERVRLVEGVRVGMAGEPHGAVGVVGVHLRPRLVDRKLIRIDADAIAMCVRVGEDPRLQHLVWRMADARYDIRRR